jgi:hypothetical protein
MRSANDTGFRWKNWRSGGRPWTVTEFKGFGSPGSSGTETHDLYALRILLDLEDRLAVLAGRKVQLLGRLIMKLGEIIVLTVGLTRFINDVLANCFKECLGRGSGLCHA